MTRAGRLRDIAARVGITQRSAYGIVTDLTAAGYVVKQKQGRRNRYQIQAHMAAARPHQPASRHRRSPRPTRLRPPRRHARLRL
jgi:DNA-binding IclR family transcriptional regulator